MLRIALLAACVAVAFAGWQNNWDGKHHMVCRNGEHIKQIKSMHSNSKEDRLWEAICAKMPGVKVDKSCRWSGYVNGWDEMLAFTCPSGTVMTGMSSYHDNGREDRRFQFYCCGARAETINCPTGRFGANCQFACQCKDNKPCDRKTGVCKNGCRAGKYGAACQFDNKCYFGKREEYMGLQSTTVSGRQCQKWSEDKPHAHTYQMRCDFVDGNTGKDPQNFCRTAMWETKYEPWCYTTDKKTRWEYCGVRKCACPRGFYGKDCTRECHCMGNDQCDANGQCRRGCARGWGGEDCQARVEPTPHNCQITGYVNNWDAYMNYVVPNGYVMSGAFSHHDNGKEDRLWKFIVCKL